MKSVKPSKLGPTGYTQPVTESHIGAEFPGSMPNAVDTKSIERLYQEFRRTIMPAANKQKAVDISTKIVDTDDSIKWDAEKGEYVDSDED